MPKGEAIRKKRAEFQEDVKDLKDKVTKRNRGIKQLRLWTIIILCDQLTEEMSDVKRQLRRVENQLEEVDKEKILVVLSR